MVTTTETLNLYSVQFVFEHTIITTTVIAESEEDYTMLAAGVIYDDLGYSELSSMLSNAQEINVTLIQKDVM